MNRACNLTSRVSENIVLAAVTRSFERVTDSRVRHSSWPHAEIRGERFHPLISSRSPKLFRA